MRVIKFRAWEDGQMLYQFDADIVSIKNFIFSIGKKSILMQYTGLKDKNGKEIYEGDIIKTQKPFLQVKWRVIYCSGVFFIVDTKNEYGRLLLLNNRNISSIIIGNIHETPELIKLYEGNEIYER